MDDGELDQLVWSTVRRWGRKGMNEAIVASVVSGHADGVAYRDCVTSVERLVSAGHLYRDWRRTRTLLKTAGDGPGAVSDAERGNELIQSPLWE